MQRVLRVVNLVIENSTFSSSQTILIHYNISERVFCQFVLRRRCNYIGQTVLVFFFFFIYRYRSNFVDFASCSVCPGVFREFRGRKREFISVIENFRDVRKTRQKKKKEINKNLLFYDV